MQPAPRRLCISLHDVAPATWPDCERVLDALQVAARGQRLRVALLVVPRYRGVDSARDRQFIAAVEARLAGGDELVLHGYTHVDDVPARRPVELMRRRVYTAGEGEFAAIGAAEAQRRLQAGLQWFSDRHWPVQGFVAPAWLMSPGAWQAVRASGLVYCGTRTHLAVLPASHRLAAPSLCYSTRSPWRRVASRAWNQTMAAMETNTPLLRLALHPRDADDAAVRWSWQRLVQRALHTRRACTEVEVVEHWLAGIETRRAAS